MVKLENWILFLILIDKAVVDIAEMLNPKRNIKIILIKVCCTTNENERKQKMK